MSNPTFRQELLFQIEKEVAGLADLHSAELDHGNEVSLDWDKFYLAEEAGVLRVFTLRCGGVLEGYAAFCLDKDPLKSNTLMANLVVMYLNPKMRRGLVGMKFLKFAEKCLIEDGANQIRLSCTLQRDLSPVFRRMGYLPFTVEYAKEIK